MSEKQPLVARKGQPFQQTSAEDRKEHYTAIIMGAGLSGMAAAIQLKRKLGLDDVLVYEKTSDVGGTWNVNRYPGAACDIPISFYSFSFYPAYNASSQWAGQKEILTYLHEVQDKFKLRNIVFRTAVETATFSRDDGLWHLSVRDEETGKVRQRTCNILLSCLGGLTIPNDPPFDPKDFNGKVFHSARWDQSVSIKDKDLVIVGNGCSAAQIVPEVIKEAKSVTQVARSRQSIVRRPHVPDGPFLRFLIRYVPGFAFILRFFIFVVMEHFFSFTHLVKGRKKREWLVKDTKAFIREVAPKKYWDVLEPDFDVAAKRRVFDTGYYESLNAPNMELIADDTVTSVKGDKVYTKGGRELRADVIALATGFKVRDYLFPLKIYNSEGVSLQDLLNKTKVKTYQSTLISGFENFFWLMGPNSATGHSSVLFTTEAQLNLVFHLIRPILAKLKQAPNAKPAPYVGVTPAAEDRFYADLRKEMKNRVWEKDGGVSWYVDKSTGLCTTLYPWSQVHFWRSCTYPRYGDFKWTGASPPSAWRSWLGWC
ncbi:flavin-containing monooxygenase [Rhodotorula paludigena]|uniref:flavin-containing monooxygenase n=1 Tax=Rhodotorula paludigena TaxID=86838 RepID=UPI003176D074